MSLNCILSDFITILLTMLGAPQGMGLRGPPGAPKGTTNNTGTSDGSGNAGYGMGINQQAPGGEATEKSFFLYEASRVHVQILLHYYYPYLEQHREQEALDRPVHRTEQVVVPVERTGYQTLARVCYLVNRSQILNINEHDFYLALL